MRLLTYQGQWTETPFRNPESLTVLAPEWMQEICKKFGGTHGFHGEPNFRLVLCESRFQLAGGHQVNVAGIRQRVEVFLPRYAVEETCHEHYVLELWNSREELLRQGYGVHDTEFDESGNEVRCMEPAWESGCYEAVWNNPSQPFMFPRNSPSEIIRWGVWVVHLRMIAHAEEIVLAKKNMDEKQNAQMKEEMTYEFSQRHRVNLGDPMISLAGVDLPT